MKKQKSSKIRSGDVFRIPLLGDKCAFGRLLTPPLCCFYGAFDDIDEPFNDEMMEIVLFSVWTSVEKAVKTGRWSVISHVPFDERQQIKPLFFKQDAINGRFYLYKNEQFRDASYKDCIGLERASIWDAEHIEDRLIGHFTNTVSRVYEATKLPPPPST